MKLYRVVGGIARIGAGELVGLTGAQVAVRRHRLEIVQKAAEGVDMIVCRPETPIEFKIGEQIWLPAPPDKSMAERLVPLEGDDGVPRPKLEAVKKAAVEAAKKPAKAAAKTSRKR